MTTNLLLHLQVSIATLSGRSSGLARRVVPLQGLCLAWLVTNAVFIAPEAFAAKPPKPIVYVRTVQKTELSETLTYPARVEPRIKAEVASEADGIVSKISAPLGTRVRPKTPLLVIRNIDPVYQYAPQVITSPVTGVVSRVEVTEGSRVARGDKLVLVTEPSQLRVVVEIPSQDVRMIHQGQVAELSVPGDTGDADIALKVKGLSPFVDPATGTAECELEPAPPEKLAKTAGGKKTKGSGAANAKPTTQAAAILPPAGSIARVTFKANIRTGLSIDENALTYRGRDPFVRVVRDGKAVLVPIAMGRKQSGMVEVLRGLKSGDQVVERSSGFISDGESVEVQKAANSPGDGGGDSLDGEG